MSVDIVVVRNPADLSGPDIQEAILSSVTIAIHRGTCEINDNEPSNIVQLSTNFRTGVRKGQVVEVMDELQGKVWRGKITGISHATRLADIWTDIDIERPTRWYQ